MPRQRVYTNKGFLEVQWAREGTLVCVVSGVQKSDSPHEDFDTHMHQFTAKDYEDLKVLDVTLHRATTKNRDASFAEQKSTDQIIDEFADILRKIYENKTVGDHTFVGVLSEFLRQLQAKERHHFPCVNGSVCGEEANCPPRTKGAPYKMSIDVETFMQLKPNSRKLLIGIPPEESVSNIDQDTWIKLFEECSS